MLWTEPYSDQSCRNATQPWPALHELQDPRRRKGLTAAQHFLDHVVLHHQLKPLGGSGGKCSSLLDRLQRGVGHGSLPKLLSDNVRRRYRILNREIDAYAS